jgi:hypothetical protein
MVLTEDTRCGGGSRRHVGEQRRANCLAGPSYSVGLGSAKGERTIGRGAGLLLRWPEIIVKSATFNACDARPGSSAHRNRRSPAARRSGHFAHW